MDIVQLKRNQFSEFPEFRWRQFGTWFILKGNLWNLFERTSDGFTNKPRGCGIESDWNITRWKSLTTVAWTVSIAPLQVFLFLENRLRVFGSQDFNSRQFKTTPSDTVFNKPWSIKKAINNIGVLRTDDNLRCSTVESNWAVKVYVWNIFIIFKANSN